MNDEIREKIKAYYIGDDIDKVLDYITNLQEENERYRQLDSKIIKKDGAYYLERGLYDYVISLQEENDSLKTVCELYANSFKKAVEYYKTHQQECVIGRNRDDRLIKDYYLPARCSKVLLNILQNGSEDK